ncbi:hypothetical protein D3C87_1105720 [compost metagenome]
MKVLFEASITDWIQAVATLVTLFVAIITYSLSRKMYHTPFKTFIRPYKLRSQDPEHLLITLKNAGPGIAFNLNVKTLHFKGMINDPINPNLIWKEDGYTFAEGPNEVVPNSDFMFEFEYKGITLSDPFIISWESISGKRNVSYWKYGRNNREQRFTLMNRRQVLNYKIHRLVLWIITPYKRLRRNYRFWKSR